MVSPGICSAAGVRPAARDAALSTAGTADMGVDAGTGLCSSLDITPMSGLAAAQAVPYC